MQVDIPNPLPYVLIFDNQYRRKEEENPCQGKKIFRLDFEILFVGEIFEKCRKDE